MDQAIQAEKLVYEDDYIEYNVSNAPSGGPPVTILAHAQGQGDVAILFIPNEPHTATPPDFLKETFDPRIQPIAYDDSGIDDIGRGSRTAYLQSSQKFLEMSAVIPEDSIEWAPGRTANAVHEAKEMGYIEGDGIEMLKELDKKTRGEWWCRLHMNEEKVLRDPHVKMRAIFEGKEQVAILPYFTSRQGSVEMKMICFKERCIARRERDWQHVRRVLFRSLHEKCQGNVVWVDCEAIDDEFLRFLRSWGYEWDTSFWEGIWY